MKKNTNSYLILKLETTTAWTEARQKFVFQSLLDLGSWDTDICSWSLQVRKAAEYWAVLMAQTPPKTSKPGL